MSKKILKKAYEINLSMIDESFLFSEEICYAETRNEAKALLLNQIGYTGMSIDKEELTYLTIPVIRCKEADKVGFEGKELTKCEIEKLLSERIRISKLDEILSNESIKYCYIKKGGYYKPNSCGYTDFRHIAGVYTKEEAVASAKGCRDIWLVVIDIAEHNTMINREIEELNTRVLTK